MSKSKIKFKKSPQEPSLRVVFLILALLVSFSMTVLGDSVQDSSGMDYGIIFKAPQATDSQNHALFSKMNHIKGAEIYLDWSDIEEFEGVYDWSVIDHWAQYYDSVGKKISISISTASFAINDSPAWLFNDYNVRRISKGYWLNFENGDKDYIINSPLISGNAVTPTGEIALEADRIDAVKTDGRKHPLISSHGYSIQFDFRLEEDAVMAVTVTSKSDDGFKEQFIWEEGRGSKGSKTVEFFPSGGIGDFEVSFGVLEGKAVIDNINIVEMRPGFFVGNLTFPNYFDPIFMEKYSSFVYAFADKYRDDSRVDLIYVGGFGRWEELTLCHDMEDQFESLEDQWETYGYTDAIYIEQIKRCVDLYKEAFGEKKLMMTVAGYKGSDYFKDQALLDWTISAYAAKKGILLKYNGWQERNTEWNNEGSSVFYTLYRHKYNENTKIIFEQGAQVDSIFSEILGHPISFMNKAIAYGGSYYWIYNNDLKQPYFTRNNQYLNESAGGVLNTKIFSHFMKFDFFSPHTNQLYNHYNLTFQIYQNQDLRGTKSDFLQIDGVNAVSTNSDNPRIRLSIDDRLKVAGMYSPVMTIEYFDEGTDSFTILVQTDRGQEVLDKITKTGTDEWITKSFDARSFTNTWRGGSQDLFAEIMIDDNGDGPAILKSLEIDYVPADAFTSEIIGSEDISGNNKISLENEISFELEIPSESMPHSLSIPFMRPLEYEKSSVITIIESLENGVYKEVLRKECYMPEDLIWWDIPLGNLDLGNKIRITLYSPEKNAFVASSGTIPAFKLLEYKTTKSPVKLSVNADDVITFRADYPFSGIAVDNKEIPGNIILGKILSDGNVQDIKILKNSLSSDGKINLKFEPQSAGHFIIEGLKGTNIEILNLNRRRENIPPKRELTGDLVSDFEDVVWKISEKFVEVSEINGGFEAAVNEKGAYIETLTEFELTPSRDFYFRFLIKNETSSSLAKFYWKTTDEDYNEKNSIFIPVIANDTSFREYSYNIGYDEIFKDSANITGLRLVPAYGNTNAGKISIISPELRLGRRMENSYNEPLNLGSVEINTAFLIEEAARKARGDGSRVLILILIIVVLLTSLITPKIFKKHDFKYKINK